MRAAPRGCVNPFARLAGEHRVPVSADWTAALREIAAAIVDELPALAHRASSAEDRHRRAAQQRKPVDAETLAVLLDALAMLEAPRLRAAACVAVVANGNAFNPRPVIVPTLQTLRDRGRTVVGDAEGERLWLHAADLLLAQSEHPSLPPARLAAGRRAFARLRGLPRARNIRCRSAGADASVSHAPRPAPASAPANRAARARHDARHGAQGLPANTGLYEGSP